MKIPKQQIEWLVARMHVSATDDQVRANIASRMDPAWTPAQRAAAERFAVKCHAANRGLYSAVVSGRV